MKYQVRVKNTDVVLKETDDKNEAIMEVENLVDIDTKFEDYEPNHYEVIDTELQLRIYSR